MLLSALLSRRLQGLALAVLLLAGSLPTVSEARPLDPSILPGLVLSAGQVHSRRDDSGLGSGFFLDANYSRVFVNFGGSFKHYPEEDLANVYLGTGIAGLLQLQGGYGTQGPVYRVRSDINIVRGMDFFRGIKRNRYNQNLGARFTLTFALENYPDDDRLDNFHAGIGLLY